MCYYCDDDDDDDHMAAHEYMFAAAVLAPCSQNLKYEMTHMTHTTAVSNDTGHLPSIMCHVTLGTEGQVHLWINLKMAF